jgi:Cu2+-exporting ATPase
MTANLAFSVVYNLCAVPLAIHGLVTPLVAALAMSGSSIVHSQCARARPGVAADSGGTLAIDGGAGTTVLVFLAPLALFSA